MNPLGPPHRMRTIRLQRYLSKIRPKIRSTRPSQSPRLPIVVVAIRSESPPCWSPGPNPSPGSPCASRSCHRMFQGSLVLSAKDRLLGGDLASCSRVGAAFDAVSCSSSVSESSGSEASQVIFASAWSILVSGDCPWNWLTCAFATSKLWAFGGIAVGQG